MDKKILDLLSKTEIEVKVDSGIESFDRIDFGKLTKKIEMPLSTIFIFKEAGKVLKVYKQNEVFFSNDKIFFEFIIEDFAFNFQNSPEIYLDLIEVKLKRIKKDKFKDEGFQFKEKVIFNKSLKKSFEKNDLNNLNNQKIELKTKNLLVLMNYFDERKILLNQIINERDNLGLEDFYKIGRDFAQIKKEIAEKGKNKFVWEKNKNVYEKYMEELNEKLRRMPNGFLGLVLRRLKKEMFLNKKDFLKLKVSDYVRSLDANLGNLIYDKKNSKLKIFDSLPPKKDWWKNSFEFNFYILGADIYFIFGEKEYREYLKGVSEIYTGFDQKNLEQKNRENICLFFGAMFTYPYYFYLGSQDDKYKKIIWRYQKNMKKVFFKFFN